MPHGLLLYDPDCGFCTRTARHVGRWPLGVDIQPISAHRLAEHGIDPSRAEREMPYVAPDGSITYGHRAWAGILLTGPWPARIVGRTLTAPGLDRLSAAVYRWVAEHRESLPGGTPACALPTAEPSGDAPNRQGTRRTAPSEAEVAIEA